MNQKDRLQTRKENLKLVDTDTYRPKINCLEIDVNNTFRHELGKFMMYWLIRKGVNADCASVAFNVDDIYRRMMFLDDDLKEFIEKNGVKLKKQEVPHIVSEARMREGHRADLFILDSGERVEIVNHNEKSVQPYNKETIVVRV